MQIFLKHALENTTQASKARRIERMFLIFIHTPKSYRNDGKEEEKGQKHSRTRTEKKIKQERCQQNFGSWKAMDVVSNIASRPKKVTAPSAKGAASSSSEILGRPRN